MNILILLAGSPPSKTLLKTEMSAADLVVAVDGGFNIFPKYRLLPDLLLGDMDSIKIDMAESVEIHNLWDQDQTDLQKTLHYLQDAYPVKSLILLGAGGRRTDHLLHNLHICALVDPSVNVIFKNEIDDESAIEMIQRVTPQNGFNLQVKKGNTLSILPIEDFKGLNSHGLKWEIVNQDRSATFISQSNLAIKDDPSFNIISGCAYIAVYQ